MKHYPTIVNLIAKQKNHYSPTAKDLAVIDNKLGTSQLGIGASSNLAQYALSISYNSKNPKYDDYTCILSVAAQVYIDSSKKSYDLDLNKEMDRIRKDLDMKENRYPAFWRDVEYKQSKNVSFSAQEDDETLAQLLDPEPTDKKERTKRGKPINNTLRCPMNILHYFTVPKSENTTETIPTEDFINTYPYKGNKRTCKRVEKLIEDYGLELYKYNSMANDADTYFLLQDDFKNLVEDIRATHLSKNYLPLMSWLINRAFVATPELRGNTNKLKTRLHKNRSLLLKTLYEVNPQQFLQIFSKHIAEKDGEN